MKEDEFDKAHSELPPLRKTPAPTSLRGKDLLDYLKGLSDKVDWIAHGFMVEASITMLYATDGIGKSLVSILSALELSSGLPVFQAFHVDRPYKVIYCMAERSIKEPTKRIKTMIQSEHLAGKFNPENFTITTEFQGKDLTNQNQSDELIEIIRGHSDAMGGVDILYFDPLYALVKGSLTEDSSICGVFDFFRRCGVEFGANIVFLHHENRGTRDVGSKERTGQDFYGSKFISGLCTAVWHMTKDKTDAFSTVIKNQKDSESCLMPSFRLEYDPEYNTVKANVSSSSKGKEILTDAFLKKAREASRKFTQEEFFLETLIQMHHVNQRSYFAELAKKKLIKNIAPIGYKGSYIAL